MCHIHTVSGKGFFSKKKKKRLLDQHFPINRSKPSPSSLHMVTWVGVGFHRGVIQRSS